MGANKKPAALRQIHGTADRNKHRDVENQPTPTGGIGPAPSHLNILECEIWDEIVGVSCPGVLGNSDRFALEMMCSFAFRFRFAEGQDIAYLSGTESGQLIGLLSRFGMTPSDRTKINVPKTKAQNRFA